MEPFQQNLEIINKNSIKYSRLVMTDEWAGLNHFKILRMIQKHFLIVISATSKANIKVWRLNYWCQSN